MKTPIQAICMGAALALQSAFAASALPEVPMDTVNEPVLNKWIGNFAMATNLAISTHTPLVMVWSGKSCDHCNTLKPALKTSIFTEWQAKSDMVYCFVEGENNKDVGINANSGARAFAQTIPYNGKRYGKQPTSYPYVCLFLVDKRGAVTATNFCGSAEISVSPVYHRELAEKTISIIENFFPCMHFTVGKTPGDRLEFEPGTKSVEVPYVDLYGNEQTMTVDTDGKEEDVTVTLEVAGRVYDETTIFYVEDRENNPKNPLWFGERNLASLAAGEWTMDRDLALAKAQLAGGSTLTLVGGALWCPDCVNVDAYLVDLPVFKDWATENGVYCAAIDVPAFPKNGKTCLLTYEPTTVSDRYVNATVPPQERVQSGAGYLSRKMVPQTGDGDDNAAAVLARNLYLTTNDVTKGGLCRPECIDPANTDTYSWKTGVPCLILQNAAGEIKGRLYQFSNVSPTDATAAAAYVQRLEELRQLADDPTEELNKHWSTATTEDCELAFGRGQESASTATVDSTVSAIDTSDFWRITGLEQWSKVTFAVGGGRGATALPSGGVSAGTDEANARLVLWRKEEGKAAVAVSAAEGNLANGFSLDDREIAADSEVEYFIQLVTLPGSEAFALEHEGDSVVSYTLTATAVEDPGVVVFTKSGDEVSEADAKKAGGTVRVYVPLARTGGATGELNVTVEVDQDATTAFADRYALVDAAREVASSAEVRWADGEMGVKSVAVDVFDDDNADGTQQLVLTVGDSTFTLKIVDNDKSNAGKLSFADAEPAPAKKGTVIAEEGSLVTLDVERIGGASGDVGCTVKTTAGAFEGETELFWRSRESGAKSVALRLPWLEDCKAGKAVVSFATLDGITADSSTKTMTVQLIAAGAPRFETDEVRLDLARYCAVTREIAVLDLAEGATAKIAKLSGSVPSGVTVKLASASAVDAVSSPRQVLQISGTPTKEGAFEAVYQVSQVLNRKTTAGLTVRLAFDVTDVSTLNPSAPGANPSVAKSRTFGDQTVVAAASRRLTGVLTGLTIPPTGKCSAKYKCTEGTLSLSATCWSAHDAETGELTATLTVAKKPYVLRVRASADGTVRYALEDPAFAGAPQEGEVAPGWSEADSAADWMGYYVAAVDAPIAEACSGTVRTSGNPYLTLKMQTAALAKKGSMSYAGVLPDGQAFSGSATLVRDGLGTAILPVYYRTAKEYFTLAPQIKAGAPAKAVESGEKILPWWTHTETVSNGCYEVCYSRIAGSYYDATVDLLDTLRPAANGHDLTAEDAIVPVPVAFTSKTLTLDKTAAKAANAKLSFTKSTGIVSGSFKTTTAAGKAVTATYKGVMLPDWGDGCPNCGELPWASGAFWYADTISYELKGKPKTLSVKAGGILYVESN